MIDQPSRDRAISDFERTLLVEAGAGTGKTTLLVKRICALIENDVPTERIAAVTFTVKAAGELKQRLREELKKRASAKAMAALESLDRMTVGTIHSLAAEFLRTLPIEAKLPPEFTPLDELQQAAVIREFRSRWLAQALDRETPFAFELAEYIGLDLLSSEDKGLASLFDLLSDSTVELANAATVMPDGGSLEDACNVLTVSVSALVNYSTLCADASDKLYLGIREIAAWLLKRPADVYGREGIDWLGRYPKPHGKLGSKKAWGEEGLITAKGLVGEVSVACGAIQQHISSRMCSEIVEWLKPAIKEFRRFTLERGAIGFDDQLLLCRDMLRDSKVARDYFKSRYSFVHIDEFQDTDPIQAEILFYLCERKDSHAKEWNSVALEPGKLFVVGDPKQSIYRFRGADLRIFSTVADRIQADAAHGEKLSISQNFRSNSDILSEVNEVFSPVMCGQNEFVSEYEPLVPRDDAPDGTDSVELLAPPKNYARKEMSASKAAAAEADAIARHIQTIAERDEQFSYSKVAVLLRRGTHFSPLISAFGAHKIPFVSFMNSAYTSRVEIEAVLTMLHALANPQFTTAVIGVLRSPWFAISDDEIYLHKLAGKTFVYTDPQPAESRVGKALLSLLDWHKRSRKMSASALLDRLLDAFPIEVVYGLKSEGIQRAQNLQSLSGVLRRIESTGALSLAEIAARLEEMTKLEQSTELEARDESRASVQIMSIHKSKGLEFDYVYLYAFSENIPAAKGWQLYKGVNGSPNQVALNVTKQYATQNLESVKRLNQEAQEAEVQRLLYVAMTRAKRKLVLPLGWFRTHHTKGDAEIPSALAARYQIDLANNVEVGNAEVVVAEAGAMSKQKFAPYASQRQILEEPSKEVAAAYSQWTEEHAARIAELTPRITTEVEQSAIEWERVRARRVGTFVHAVLEQLAKGKSVEHAERLAARTISLDSEDLNDARTMIARARNSELFKTELPAAKQVFTELPIVEQKEFLSAKFVDLVFEKEYGEWVILDYKTDGFPMADLEKHKKEHSEQLSRYAEMFASVTKQKPAQVRVYFLRHDLLVTL
jgi:ATP-dependent helicase/nuclease subunit A